MYVDEQYAKSLIWMHRITCATLYKFRLDSILPVHHVSGKLTILSWLKRSISMVRFEIAFSPMHQFIIPWTIKHFFFIRKIPVFYIYI